MSTRARILAFGSAGILVIAGALCAALVSGLTGQLLTIVLISLGLAGAVLLVFLEIGLSEDRELAREARRRAKPPRTGPVHAARHPMHRIPRRRG